MEVVIQMSKFPLDGSSFDIVEQDFYIDPPVLPDTATEKEVKTAWFNWVKENAKQRGIHKALFTKSQKIEVLADSAYSSVLIKQNGVHKQRSGLIGFIGNADNVETILIERATQDRHFRTRGGRAGKKASKHTSIRASRRESKRKRLLSLR